MSSKKTGLQPLRMKPLTGSFDSRSLPELVAPQSWRMLQNTRTTARGNLCRMPGWEKFLSGLATGRDFNNEDLHDQLIARQIYYDTIADVDSSSVVAYPPNNDDFGDFCGTTRRTRSQERQPITFGAEITSSLGTRHCVVGTQSRLYALNFGRGNWKIIADGLGGTASNPEIRFQHAALGDYVFFTNNFDEMFYWQIDAPTFGCAMQSVQTIPELREIGVTKVGCIASFKGTLFMANVEQDGQRFVNRIIWSRYQSPLEVVEDPGVSTAGTQDLDFGETILAMKELGDFLYIYTDRAIWVAVVTGGDSTFAFVRKYRAQKGDGTLVYPFTLTASKESHYYGSTDGIYEWNPYITAPVRQEWIHQSSNILYDDMNRSACAAHTAGYSPTDNELWFSFAQGTSKLPSITLTCNTTYGQCSKVDHGFTCLFSFTPDTRESVRDFLLRNCIADESCLSDPELLALGFTQLKEGPSVASTVPTCDSLVQHIYTDESLTVGTADESGVDRSVPQLDFSGLTNWLPGGVQTDLLGMGSCGETLQDIIPGNGMYLRAIVPYGDDYFLESVDFDLVTGYSYKLEVRLAGGNVDLNDVRVVADIDGMPGQLTMQPAWNDPFATFTKIFESVLTGAAHIEMQFNNLDIEGVNEGPLIDQVRVTRIDPDTEDDLEVLLDDNFNNENIIGHCSESVDLVTEDYTQAEASDDSLCALLGESSVADGCHNCDVAAVFVGASATDWCLKQIGTIYARERRTDDGYVLDGYDMIWLKGPMMFGSDIMKQIEGVILEFKAEPQTIPSQMKLRVGACQRCEDPLVSCGIQWYEEESRPIQCVDDDRNMEWAAFAVDRALYLEFKISGTGGASCYSSLQVNVGSGGC